MNTPHPLRRRARRLSLFALLAAISLGATLLAGSRSDGAAAGSPRAREARVVGQVTLVSGTSHALAVQSGEGPEHPLREGEDLHLGDVIDPDEGVRATLVLTEPKGLSGDPDLVRIAPGKAEQHTVTLEHTGPHETTVMIGD